MSKNSQGFVLVVGLGIKQNQVKPAADLAGKSCKQVRDILGFAANEILAIRSPLFVRTLKNDEIPLKLFPQLVIKERPTKYSFPDYCLMQFDESKQNTFTIFVKPVVKDVEEIPPFRATIEVTKELTSAKMMKIIDESFKMEHTNAKILNFNEKTKVKDVLKIVKSKRIEMQCELTESAKKKMATRRSIIREIETTEESYISGLQTIMDVWQPRMVKSGKFTESELGMMFKQFPGIIRCHSLFLEQLKARGCDFKADISDIFLDFADFFKVSAPYISNYAGLIGMLAGKSKGNDESLFTLEDGREFSSFLITPVQRMPRYILFLRELMKVTPESHPDYRALEGASTKIQTVTLEMDEATKQAGNANEIMELQQMLTKPVNLLLAGRVILKSVQIDSLKNGGKIYLFNDIVVIVVGARKGWKLRWMGPVQDFRYFSAMCDVSFYGGKKKKMYSVSFDNLVDEQQFLEALESTRMKHFPEASSMFVWSIPFLGKFLPDMRDCQGAMVNQVCYFVGAGKVVTFGLYGGAVKVDDTPFSELTGFTMENFGDKLYVFGGVDHSGEVSADLWSCNYLTNSWTKTKPFVEGRYGHSSVLFGDSMYIFGGRKKKGYFNDVCIYNFNTGNWKSVSISGAPSPRYDHSACIVRDRMIIYGGRRGNEVFGDVYEFDMVELTWNVIKMDWGLPKMFGHRALTIGPLVFFMGGVDNQDDIETTFILDMDTWKMRSFKSAGNRPMKLANFAVVYDGQKLIVMFGLSIFFVELPQAIKNELGTRNTGGSKLSAICRRSRQLASASRHDFSVNAPRIKKDHRSSIGPVSGIVPCQCNDDGKDCPCEKPAPTPAPKEVPEPGSGRKEQPRRKSEVKTRFIFDEHSRPPSEGALASRKDPAQPQQVHKTHSHQHAPDKAQAGERPATANAVSSQSSRAPATNVRVSKEAPAAATSAKPAPSVSADRTTPQQPLARRATTPVKRHPDLQASAPKSPTPENAAPSRPSTARPQAPAPQPLVRTQTQVQSRVQVPVKPKEEVPHSASVPVVGTVQGSAAPAKAGAVRQTKPQATTATKPRSATTTVQIETPVVPAQKPSGSRPATPSQGEKPQTQHSTATKQGTGGPLTRPATSTQLLKTGAPPAKTTGSGAQAQHPMKSASNTKFEKTGAPNHAGKVEGSKPAPQAQAAQQKALGFDYFAKITKGSMVKVAKMTSNQTVDQVIEKVKGLFKGVQCTTIDVLVDGEKKPLNADSLSKALVEFRETRATHVNIVLE